MCSLPRFFAISLMLLLLSSCSWKDPKGSMVVMTLNARYDNPADAPNNWQSRRPVIVKTIVDKSADIIGFQEILKNQLDDLDSLLPWYDYIGVGREDGKDKGEFSPVFFKMNRFEALEYGTLWLSETPSDTGSVGWDAALPRILTWVKFRDLHQSHDGKFLEFYFLNTHFDHMGDTARLNSAFLIRDFISHKASFPVVLTGDFNCSASEPPYHVLTGITDGHPELTDACGPTLTGDAMDEPTFNGFGKSTDNQRIDFIFTNNLWDIFSYETLKVKEGNIYISDHYPVISRIKVTTF
jgi:endonuclease/exonuclease/phosphatase family metal-dependent hydrolase